MQRVDHNLVTEQQEILLHMYLNIILKRKYNFEKKCYILSSSPSSLIFLKYLTFSNESAFLPKERSVLQSCNAAVS